TLLQLEEIEGLTSWVLIDSLIRFQSTHIESLPILDVASNEKKLILFKLNRYLFSDLLTVERILSDYFRISTAYLSDLEWIEKSVQLIIDVLFKRIAKSNDNGTYFLKYYQNLNEHFEIHSRFGLSILCRRMVERSLELNMSDSGIRSFILLATGEALDWLIDDYMKKTETRNIFSINLTKDIDLKENQSVKELILLVEKYLFCMPILKQEWVWDLQFPENESPKIMKETLFESLHTKILLNHELFLNLFSEIVQKLENWGYDKKYPLQASIFQLMVHNKMTPLRNKNIKSQNHLECSSMIYSNHQVLNSEEEFFKMISEFQIPDDNKIHFAEIEMISKDFLKEFKNVTHLDQINALKTVLGRLINQKNFDSSLKALAIFDFITEDMWKSDSKDLAELFMKITDNANLYPSEIDKISCNVVKIAKFFKYKTQSLEMPTKLCLHLLNKLESKSIFKHILQFIPENSMEISNLNLKSAFMLFPEFLYSSLFDRTHKDFEKFFNNQLDLFLKSESIAATQDVINNFIIASIDGMENWPTKEKKNIFEIVSPRFKLLIPVQDEYLEENMNIICGLSYIGYFKSQPKHLVDAWNMIIQLFPSSRSNVFYCKTIVLRKLVSVMTILCPSLEENKEEKKKSLCRLIKPYIKSIIVDDFTHLEDNVNMLRYLDSFGYFDKNWLQYEENLNMIACHISHLKQLDVTKGISIETFNSVKDLC
nr:hypothetical protein [Nitrosopumilus sp.]